MALASAHGTTITLGTSAFGGNLLSLEWSGWGRQSIDVTSMDTTGGRAYIPSVLQEGGEITARFHYDWTVDYTVTTGDQTIAIAWGGVTTGLDDNCNGFITSINRSAEVDDGYPVAEVTFKVNGAASDS